MPVDTSIYSSLLRPVKSVAEYDAEYEVAEQNKLARLLQKQQMGLGQMKMDEYTRGVERQNRLQAVLGGLAPGASLGQRQNALQSGGFWGEADALGKSQLDAQKTQSEIDAKKAEAVTKNAELIKKGLGYVFNNPTPEAAMQAIAIVEQQTGQDLSLYRQQVQSLQTPEQLKQWAAGHALEVEKSLPKTDVTNMGATQSFGATNPLTGVRTETGSAPIAVSPNTVATNERQAADAAASRAVQMRGQNMTDARGRDANDINRSLVGEQRQLAIDAATDKATERAQKREAAISTVTDSVAVLDKAISHPGRETVSGWSGVLDPRNIMPTTDATNFKAVLAQIKGKAFLEAFSTLKGGGQITEVEGKKATEAIVRLDTAQSDAEFLAALKELRGIMANGYKRLTKEEYAPVKATSGLPRVKSVDEAMKLPKGTKFIDPNGVERVR